MPHRKKERKKKKKKHVNLAPLSSQVKTANGGKRTGDSGEVMSLMKEKNVYRTDWQAALAHAYTQNVEYLMFVDIAIFI